MSYADISASSNTQSRQSVWFCHECNREGVPIRTPDPQCRYCRSSFVEELESDELGDDLRMWHMGVNPAGSYLNSDNPTQDYSPPIPGTRQRYDQQERERERESQAGMENVLDPILNIFGIQNVPSHQQSQSNTTNSSQRGFQTFSRYEFHRPSSNSGQSESRSTNRRVNLSEFLGLGNEGQPSPGNENSTSSSRASGERSTSEAHRASSDSIDYEPIPEDPSPPLPGRFTGGLYTFTFDSRAPTPVFGFQPSAANDPSNQSSRSDDRSRAEGTFRAPHEDPNRSGNATPALQGFFSSLLQHALGHASPAPQSSNDTRPENSRRSSSTPAQHHGSSTSASSLPGSSSEGRASSSPSESGQDQSSGTRSDEGNPFQRGPNTDTRGVNLEEGHPLRQFLNLINSLNPQDPTSRGEGGFNGFILNGGTGFGFATNLGSGGTAGHSNLGDYVFGETAMQDILNQLMNMAGANAGYDQVPASEAKIKSMKQYKFAPDPNGEVSECAICKDDFTAGDECMELPCKHFFHSEDCIKPWLKQSGTCPVCRYSLVNEHENNGNNTESGSLGSSPAASSTRGRGSSFDSSSPQSPGSNTGSTSRFSTTSAATGSTNYSNETTNQSSSNSNNSNYGDSTFELPPDLDVD